MSSPADAHLASPTLAPRQPLRPLPFPGPNPPRLCSLRSVPGAAAVAAARARILAAEAALPQLRERLGVANAKLARVLAEVEAQRSRPAPGTVERAVAGLPAAEGGRAGVLGEQSPGLSPAAVGAADAAAYGAALRQLAPQF